MTMRRLASALVLLVASAGAYAVEFDARVQWYTTAQILPPRTSRVRSSMNGARSITASIFG